MLQSRKIFKEIEDQKIIKEYGFSSAMLPQHLKIFGKDKSYNQREPKVPDRAVISEIRRDLVEGKEFQKKVHELVKKEHHAMAKARIEMQ